MKKTFLSVLVILSFSLGYSQTNGAQNGIPEAQRKLDALKGTFEVKSTSTSRNQNASLPSNLADIIENNRKDNELNRIQLGDDVVLIIYPKSQLVNGVPATKK